MGFSTIAKNAMLDFEFASVFVSLHSADPGQNGSNEISGGSPAYARKQVLMAAASGGSKAATNQPVIDVPPSTTIGFVGYWTQLSGGTFLGSAAITPETYGAQGTYTLLSETFTIS